MTWGPGFTDMDNVERLAHDHAGKLVFSPGVGWLRWTGMVWEEVGGEPLEAALETVAKLEPQRGTDLNAYYKDLGWYVRSRNERGLRAMLSLARDMPGFRRAPGTFDANPAILNTRDGILDLDTLELLPHDPGAYCTKITGVGYKGGGKPERWLDHVGEAMRGDREMIEFLHRALGYSIGGSTEEQALFIAHGPGGTGKSVTFNVVRRILGDYAQVGDRNLLIKSPANVIGHNIVQLRGARFAIASETGHDNELDEVAVKQLTGCDAVTARLLHRNNVTFVPSVKLWLVTNRKPGIKSQDTGIWRRIREIPFDHVIEKTYREKDYDARLVEEEGPAILRWLVKGYRKWRTGGLTEPAAVMHAVAEYRDEGDRYRLGDFISEMLEVRDGARASNTELYETYEAWHGQVEDPPKALSKLELIEKLSERGFRRHRWDHGTTRGLLGLDVGKARVAN